MSDVITKEILQHMREYCAVPPLEPPDPVFVVPATEDHAQEIAALFGVKWSPDDEGTQQMGMYRVMTKPVYLEEWANEKA